MKTGEYYEVRPDRVHGAPNPAVPDLLSEIGAPLAKNK
jgi:hypothetical protein